MTQDHTPELRMEKALREYFHGEKNNGLVLITWGIVGLVVAGLLMWKFSEILFRGLAAPVGLIALLHVTSGAIIFLRSSKQAKILAAQVQTTPKQFVEEESRRMEQVASNVEKYKLAGQLLFFLGWGFVAGGAFFGGGEYMLGSGIGLCVQSFMTLVFDLFASFRGGLYLHELKVFKQEM